MARGCWVSRFVCDMKASGTEVHQGGPLLWLKVNLQEQPAHNSLFTFMISLGYIPRHEINRWEEMSYFFFFLKETVLLRLIDAVCKACELWTAPEILAVICFDRAWWFPRIKTPRLGCGADPDTTSVTPWLPGLIWLALAGALFLTGPWMSFLKLLAHRRRRHPLTRRGPVLH